MSNNILVDAINSINKNGMSENTNAALINAIITLFNRIDFSCNSWNSRLKNLLQLVVSLKIILLSNYYINNSEHVHSLMFSFIRPLIYSKKTWPYKTEDGTNIGYQIENSFKELRISDEYKGMMSISYFIINGEISINYSKIFHNKFMKNLLICANTKISNFIKEQANPITTAISIIGPINSSMNNNIRQLLTTDNMFPSKNYVNFIKSIKFSIDINIMKKVIKNFVCLIQGEPGLGKTKVLDFIKVQNLVHTAIYYNMNLFTDKSFGDFVKHMIKPFDKKGITLIMIDEIDKWMEIYITNTYRKKCDDKNKNNNSNSDSNNNNNNNNNTLNNSNNEIENIVQFKLEVKLQILTEIRNLIDMQSNHITIFVFCTNNFESMFDGLGDNIQHFESLKSCFTEIKFEHCDKKELIGYCKHHNNCIKGNEMYVEENELNKILEKISPNIKLTYRQIDQLLIQSGFNISIFIDLCNEKYANIK